jgi:glycosyltransferase involved in cell wall biosynthesis
MQVRLRDDGQTVGNIAGKPIRVVINGRFAAQAQTGVQRYAQESLRAMDALLDERPEMAKLFDITVAIPDAAEITGLKRISVKHVSGRANHLWEQVALLNASRGALLLNFNYSGPVLKRDQIITIHDATACVFPESFSLSYRLVHRLLITLLKNRVARVMTVSNFSQTELDHYFGIKNAAVCTEGWQHSVANGDSAAILDKYGLASGQYLFAAGSVKPNKNFAVIGKALKLLPDLPIQLAIAGAKDISIFAQDDETLFENRRISMLGYVPDEDLAHLYRNAAWFVFPSLYEGFGLPAIEAMANGCPVIAARAASIPEVCGDAALYFDPNDAQSLADVLKRAVQEPDLRTQFLARAPQRLALYSWRRNADIIFRQIAHLAGRSVLEPVVEERYAAPFV